MKTYITLLLLVAAIGAQISSHAQSQSIAITNYSNCQITLQLMSNDPTTPCAPGPVSGYITMVPGDYLFFADPTAVPIGLASPMDNIVAARLYFEYPGSCTGLIQYFPVGDWCTGYPMSTSYTSLSFLCQSCNVTAVWTSGSTLDFY